MSSDQRQFTDKMIVREVQKIAKEHNISEKEAYWGYMHGLYGADRDVGDSRGKHGNTNLDAVSCDYCEYGDINGEIRCSLRDIALELEVSGQFHYTKRNGFMPFFIG